ncbi:MAG TPA: Asp-tRNA(Asn)/Glu-tRNA(Gln) amidotransferase subunit GatA [Bdellovibrionota bacterium]|nr:Asp-tRNA(Asn)/Glu-tRNA(Gln) amidotransferase subunit GatA [Bdellovibrionota bacterium]
MDADKLQTIRAIHDSFDKKQASVVEVTRHFLDSVKKKGGKDGLNAFLTVCENRVLERAEAADQILRAEGKVPRDRVPLFGIPLGIKDNLTMDGVRTTCGSKMLDNYVAPYTATCVERLESAGALCLGKLNMDEFAMGGSNENSAYGPVLHPTQPERVPGGSSGGSAAAVRAGLCVAALGTDTGGSIRLPASYCGIVGLKPTYGRVSRYGLVAFASSLDQVGPMARTVEDAAILFDVMSGHDPRDATSATVPKGACREALRKAPETQAEWNGIRIGVPKEYFVGGLSAEVEKSIQSSLRWFESKGARVIPISLPHTQYAVAVYYLVAVSEASSNLARFDGVRYGVRPAEAENADDLAAFYRKVRAHFGPEVKRRIILGTFALSSGYSEAYYRRACQVRRLIKQDFATAFEKVDFIAGPVSPTTAFKIGERISDPLQMYLNDIFTIPANLAGLPAISIPSGTETPDSLPIGLHLIAPPFQEERLLSLAHAFEKRGAAP